MDPLINTSGSIAKERLKLLLTAERMNCTSGTLIMLKNDMIQAAGKYAPIDEVHVSITYSESSDVIVASLPLQQHSTRKRIVNTDA